MQVWNLLIMSSKESTQSPLHTNKSRHATLSLSLYLIFLRVLQRQLLGPSNTHFTYVCGGCECLYVHALNCVSHWSGWWLIFVRTCAWKKKKKHMKRSWTWLGMSLAPSSPITIKTHNYLMRRITSCDIISHNVLFLLKWQMSWKWSGPHTFFFLCLLMW